MKHVAVLFLAAVLILLLMSMPGNETLAISQEPSAQTGEAADLDAAIQEVIRQREYQWRMPREITDEEDQSLLYDFLQGLNNTFRKLWKPISEVWSKLNRWLRRQLSSFGPDGSGREWTAGEMNTLILVLVALLALVILFFIWRHRKKRRPEIITAEPIQPIPDLSDENVVADQLPEEGWQKLAQDLLARGELRLALRAMFMATLAHLAQVRLITIARFKSNREYLHELKRRAYDQVDVQKAFDENVTDMDSVWYGMYPVSEDLLRRFTQNVEIVTREAA